MVIVTFVVGHIFSGSFVFYQSASPYSFPLPPLHLMSDYTCGYSRLLILNAGMTSFMIPCCEHQSGALEVKYFFFSPAFDVDMQYISSDQNDRLCKLYTVLTFG